MKSNTIAIILAAGKGIRLGAITKQTPKPLLSVGGMSLLEHALRFIQEIMPEKIIVSARYQYEKLEQAVVEYNQIKNQHVNVVKVGYGTLQSFSDALPNDFFGSVLCRDSDYVFSKNILLAVKNNLAKTGMFCSYDISSGTEDVMKVKTDGKGRMVGASKILTDFDAVYTGIFTIASEDMSLVREIINEQFSKYTKEDPRVEVIFDELVSRGREVLIKDIGAKEWFEIDTPEELRVAENFFKK